MVGMSAFSTKTTWLQEAPRLVPGHGHGICPLRPGVRIWRNELDESSVGGMSQTYRSVVRPTWQTLVIDSPWPSSTPWSESGRLWTGNPPWILHTPGRWTGTNVIALLSHHLSSRMVFCIKVCDLVPPSFLMYATVTALSDISRTTRDLRWGRKSLTA